MMSGLYHIQTAEPFPITLYWLH